MGFSKLQPKAVLWQELLQAGIEVQPRRQFRRGRIPDRRGPGALLQRWGHVLWRIDAERLRVIGRPARVGISMTRA